MKKTLFLLLMGLAFCNPIFADENDFRCLKSIHQKKPIKLKFTFPQDNQKTGSVIYQNGKSPIPVKLKVEKTIEEVPNGRPWVIQSVWEESAKEGNAGNYSITSQGADIIEFKYVRKDGKVFLFEVDDDASTENGCRW